jgi:heme oxygenase
MTAGSRDQTNGIVVDAPVSLTEIMRASTRALHARAERSGIINSVLCGRTNRYGYALLLRNLLPAYRCLETGLEAHRNSPTLGAVVRSELYRAPALESDLNELVGGEWDCALPLLPAGQQYAQRVALAAERGDGRLIAHAYTRYLGDLSGGQVLKRLLGRTLGLRSQQLSFFEFPAIDDIEAFKQRYRRALDDCGTLVPDVNAVVAEAIAAFELNIAVSQAVQITALNSQ